MHNASHPGHGKEERGVNPVLQDQLKNLRDLPQWSNNKLAQKLGCNAAYVQGYINGEFPGDLLTFERKLADFFDNEARRRASGVDTTECDDATQMRTAFEQIRKTNDLGVLIGESGEGKTRGIDYYVTSNPLAILYRTSVWSNDKQSVESTMFERVGRAGYDGRTKRAIFMVNKLRGSDRLIIVDDAHKLTIPALQWFVDFHEETQCPMALVGTYALLDKIESDPQRFSRAGLYEEIRQLDDKGNLIVDRNLLKYLIKQLLPEANGETSALCDLAEQVALQHGHYRSVHKQLKLAADIMSGSKKLTAVTAFHAAHRKLFRQYKLN
jgi:DNA transposition AAA+ family ATPase